MNLTLRTSSLRRLSVLLVPMLFAGLLLVAMPESASAAPNITGRVRDVTTNQTVSGATVRLRIDNAGSPGAVVDTAVTSATGAFSLTPDLAGRRYLIQLAPGTYQGGYLGHASRAFVPLGEEGQAWAPGAATGNVLAYPAFVQGKVVDADTGRAVVRAVVSLRSVDDLSLIAQTTTKSDGTYRIDGITRDEFGVRISGPGAYETGYQGCLHGVVQAWADACSFGTGKLGNARLERL